MRVIQFIETDNKRNIDRYPGKSNDNPRTPPPQSDRATLTLVRGRSADWGECGSSPILWRIKLPPQPPFAGVASIHPGHDSDHRGVGARFHGGVFWRDLLKPIVDVFFAPRLCHLNCFNVIFNVHRSSCRC